ncbi:hypothetical protein [Streptomyces sp. NPDC018584]|uniref:hypothetical protein n=1 Tax=unclassified Streptomyces TaxID=2593676 RepID=UPI0037BC83FB
MEIELNHRPGQSDDSGHFYQVFVWAPEFGAWRRDEESNEESVAQDRAKTLMAEGIDADYVRMVTIDYVIEEV